MLNFDSIAWGNNHGLYFHCTLIVIGQQHGHEFKHHIAIGLKSILPMKTN